MSSNAQKARRSADTLEIVYDLRWSVEARREIAASLAAPGFARDTLLQAMETRDRIRGHAMVRKIKSPFF